MRPLIPISFALAPLLIASQLHAQDLGTISVESSTIDDTFENKKDAVSNTFYIDSEDVEKMNPTNVEDVLNTIPGMTTSNVGNDRVKIHIRGVDNQRYMGEKPGVAVVIDGVPVQETTGKINLDLDNIETIKVIKGSASYLYGNDAIAGAVVITTKRAKGVSSSKVESEIGSFGSKRVLASTNQGFENSALQLQASYRETDGYWDDAYLEHKSINGKYQYYLTDYSDITFGVDYTERETGDGTSVSGVDMAENDPESKSQVSYSGYYDTTLTKTFITYSRDIDPDSNIMLNFSRYEDDKTNLTDRDDDETGHNQIKDEEWIQNTLKAEYRKKFERFAVMGGVSVERNSQDYLAKANQDFSDGWGADAVNYTKGDITGDSEIDEDINALYLELRNQITSKLTTTLNYRKDVIKYDYTNRLDNSLNVDPSYNTDSYRAGLNYKFDESYILYSSVSSGFRTPDAEDISSNKELLNDDPSLDVPTDLDPEKTYNYELGLRGDFGQITYDTSIYQLDRKDYLGRRAGTYMFSVDDDEDKVVDNLGDIQSRGYELALQSKVNSVLSFNLAYTYLQAKFDSYSINPKGEDEIKLDGNYVPRTSKHTVDFIIDYSPIPNLTISPELLIKGSYYADEANEYKQDGYEIVNLRANYAFNDSLEVFAKVDNLLDEDYYQFATVSYGDTMDEATIRVGSPASYYAGIRYKF